MNINDQNTLNVKDFAKYFKGIYEARWMNKAELSRASGVSEATLSRIEAGTQRPSPETLKKLAPHLMVPEKELMVKAGYLRNDISDKPVSKLAFLLRSAEELTPEDQEEIGDMLQVLIERRRAKQNAKDKQD